MNASVKGIVAILQIQLSSTSLAKLCIFSCQGFIDAFNIGGSFVKEFKELSIPNFTDLFELTH